MASPMYEDPDPSIEELGGGGGRGRVVRNVRVTWFGVSGVGLFLLYNGDPTVQFNDVDLLWHTAFWRSCYSRWFFLQLP